MTIFDVMVVLSWFAIGVLSVVCGLIFDMSLVGHRDPKSAADASDYLIAGVIGCLGPLAAIRLLSIAFDRYYAKCRHRS